LKTKKNPYRHNLSKLGMWLADKIIHNNTLMCDYRVTFLN